MGGNHQIVLFRSLMVRALGAIASVLVLASLGGQLTKYLTGDNSVYVLVRLLNLNRERGNIPTFFSALLLLFAALLLWIIGVMKRKSRGPYALHWTILAFTFLYLAVDEATVIHELLNRPTRELLGNLNIGTFNFAWWAIPGTAITLFFGLLFLKFLLHLPLETRLFVLLAAILYVGGAIGVEVIGSQRGTARA